MPADNAYDVLVVGAGPGGLSAAMPAGGDQSHPTTWVARLSNQRACLTAATPGLSVSAQEGTGHAR